MDAASAVRTSKEESSDAMGGENGHFLRDHAAHGKSHDKGLVYLQMVQDAERISSQLCHVVGARRGSRAAGSAIIECYGLVISFKERNLAVPRP